MIEYLRANDAADTSPQVAGAAAWAMAHGLSRQLLEQGLRPGEDGLPGEKGLVRQSLHMLALGMAVGSR